MLAYNLHKLKSTIYQENDRFYSYNIMYYYSTLQKVIKEAIFFQHNIFQIKREKENINRINVHLI